MGKLRIQLATSKNKLEQFARALEELRESEEASGLRLLSCDVAYAGTSVTIGPAFYRFRQETRPVRASLIGEEISII